MIKRMHVAINYTDLGKSLAFYRSFFGAEPTKMITQWVDY
jgi:extradiol dioxygenase family protein